MFTKDPNSPVMTLLATSPTRSSRRWRAAVVGLVFATVAMIPGIAEGSAGRHRGWEHIESPLGLFYGNVSQVDGFVTITGGGIADVCSGARPEIAAGLRRQNDHGTWRIKTIPGGFRTTVSLYETDLPVFEFIPATCADLASGERLPVAFATGHVVARASIGDVADPSAGFETQLPGRYRNGLRGVVETPDGTRYRLRVVVDFAVDEAGNITPFQDSFNLNARGRHHRESH